MSEETGKLSECITEIKELVKVFGTLDVSEEAEEVSRTNKSGNNADRTRGKIKTNKSIKSCETCYTPRGLA